MKYVINKILFALFSFSLVVVLVPSLLAETVQFVDVSVGDSEKESSCIFKINRKTVVVDWHETVTVDDITIFVKNIYPTHSATQEQDRCEFLYSSSLSSSSEKESLLKKTQIGNKLLTFFLGSRAAASAAEETEEEIEQETETGFHETPEIVRVLIDGYDVTADLIDTSDTTGDVVAVAEEMSAEAGSKSEKTVAHSDTESEEQGFLSTFFSWMFGKK